MTGYGLGDCDPLHEVSDPFRAAAPLLTGRVLPLDSVRLPAPTVPGPVMGRARKGEPYDRRFPPGVFPEPPGSVIDPGDPIPLPGQPGRVDGEDELALIIGCMPGLRRPVVPSGPCSATPSPTT